MIRVALIWALLALARALERAAESLARCPACGGNPYRDPPCQGSA